MYKRETTTKKFVIFINLSFFFHDILKYLIETKRISKLRRSTFEEEF